MSVTAATTPCWAWGLTWWRQCLWLKRGNQVRSGTVSFLPRGTTGNGPRSKFYGQNPKRTKGIKELRHLPISGLSLQIGFALGFRGGLRLLLLLVVVAAPRSALSIWGQFRSKFIRSLQNAQVFCESAIDSAQSDHSTKCQAILADKDRLRRTTWIWWYTDICRPIVQHSHGRRIQKYGFGKNMRQINGISGCPNWTFSGHWKPYLERYFSIFFRHRP